MLKSIIIISALLSVTPVYAQSGSAESREEQLYKNGTNAMNAGQWQNAIGMFSQIKGSKADGAMYWQAYSLYKLYQRPAALEMLESLMKQYPRSNWINDAKALEIEISGPSGQASTQSVAQAPDGDEDLKLYAINGLMNMDPERAVPLLEQVISGSQSTKIKDRALFVLAQNSSQRAQDLMARIARGQVQPGLQTKAIQNLGISGRRQLLADIYSTGSNESKRAVLRAMGIAGAKDELLAAARSERDPQLRKEAVNGLAIAGGREQLRQLYKEAPDVQTKRELMRSAVITGDREILMNALQNETDFDLRREAINNLGISGGSETPAFLANIYNTDKDARMRTAALDALFIRGAAHELVELVKKETDPQMKKRIVEKLALMNNKEATDYLIQLLEK